MCGSRPLIESYYIDTDKIAEAKAQAIGVDYVSTNDILTSTFGNATSARLLLMAINFRDKLPDFKADDAGNYEGALVFGPDDYATPTSIRQTLNTGPPAYRRGAGLTTGPAALPGCCENLRCQISMVTNMLNPNSNPKPNPN